MTPELAVAAGAVVGAPARYLLDQAVTARAGPSLPWGILAVHLLGSAAAGLLVGLDPGALLLTLLGVGFLGSFTTASTLAWDVLAVGARAVGTGALLLTLHVAGGLALASAGFLLGRAL